MIIMMIWKCMNGYNDVSTFRIILKIFEYEILNPSFEFFRSVVNTMKMSEPDDIIGYSTPGSPVYEFRSLESVLSPEISK